MKRVPGVIGRFGPALLAGTLLAATFLVVGAPAPAGAAGCDTSWTNPSGGAWTDATNWSAGVPDSTTSACITLSGTYTVTSGSQNSGLSEARSLTLGGTSGVQTLSIDPGASPYTETINLYADSTIRPHGVITMLSVYASAVRLRQLEGTLTNHGVIHLEGGPTYIGVDLDGSVVNTGSIIFDSPSTPVPPGSGDSLTITNTGTVTVPNLVAATVADFVNDGGTVDADTLGFLAAGSYTQGDGTTSGTSAHPVVASALHYTGSGASVVAVDSTATIDGKVVAGQTIDIEGCTPGQSADLTAVADWSNAGTINLDGNNGASCAPVAFGEIDTTPGTFTNTGTVNVEPGTLARHLYGNFTNDGSVAIDNAAIDTDAAGTFANHGAMTLTGSCAAPATLATHASWSSSGTVDLTDVTSGPNCNPPTQVIAAAGTFTNTGTIHLAAVAGTTAIALLGGAVENAGTVAVEARTMLDLTGAVTETPSATLQFAIADPNDYGIINGAIDGGASLHVAGTLVLQTSGPPPGLKQSLRVVDCVECFPGSFPVTGGFAAVSQSALPGGLAFAAKRSSMAVTLTVENTADLGVVGSAPATVGAGSTFAYSFTVHNAGPTAANKVTFTDKLPAGLAFSAAASTSGTCANAAGVVTCSLKVGDLKSVTVTVTVVAGAAATVTNTAAVSSLRTVDVAPADDSVKVKVKIH